MNRTALQMLTGDRNKYLVLVCGVAFATLLMAHQASVFWGVMRRTTSEIRDIHPDGIWVMNSEVRYVDEFKPLTDGDPYRVRGIDGVAWAVALYKGLALAQDGGGAYREALLLGIDDDTLIGGPRQMSLGTLDDLRQPDAVIIDTLGYSLLWPGESPRLGRVLQLNDRRAVVVGVCRASPLFQTLSIIYTRFGQAIRFDPAQRHPVAYVLAAAEPGVSPREVCARIQERTGLLA